MEHNDCTTKVIFLSILLLISSVSPLFMESELLELDKTSKASQIIDANTFSSGSSTTTIMADMGGSAIFPHQDGHRLLNASVGVEVLPHSTTQAMYHNMVNAQTIGTLNNTSVTPAGVELLNSNSGPPGAGNNSTTILNGVQWSGTHSYDTLDLRCGIQNCGSISATGSLTINVRILVVAAGTTISANAISGSGTGVGGSTTATQSGNSDGGGGAGHGGSGGGGGSAGGNGGSSYGNSTESGSQGGSVSSSNHATAVGGKGGGYIRIIADQIDVNGTIKSDGGNGANGQAISGGSGPGGSGAGGGSGGSIFIKANTVNVGLGGIIQAVGGDGGDGASSFCTGACIGLYNGGDGGGGGAGGRISIMTQMSNYNNQGTISVSGGNGGNGGQPYGTGSAGTVGASGSTGVSSSSTWAGYTVSGADKNDGTFITDAWLPNAGQIIDGWVNHTSTIPVNSSLIFKYRYTISGSTTDTSTDWSDWNIGNISSQILPRLTALQFSYQFNRTGALSPELSDYTIFWDDAHVLNNLEMTMPGGSTLLGPLSQNIGYSNVATIVSNSNSHTVNISIPTNSIPTSSLNLWIGWPTNSATDTIEVQLGGLIVYSGAMDSELSGVDVEFTSQQLINSWPSIGTVGADGVEMSQLVFNISTTMAVQLDAIHPQMSWSWTHTLDLTSNLTQYAFAACHDWYNATSSCLPQYIIQVSGDTVPFNFQNYEVTLKDLSVQWIDDIPPQIASVDHRIGGNIGQNIRVGDSFAVTVGDVIGETTMTGSIWIHQGDSTKPATTNSLTYFSALGRYVTSFNPTGYDPTSTTHNYIALELVDVHGNMLFVERAYEFDIGPAFPSVNSVSMTAANDTHSALSESEDFSTWELHDEGFMFSVTAQHNRSDLLASVTLTPSEGNSALIMLTWDENESAYTAFWTPNRGDLKTWELEVDISETSGQMAEDFDGLKSGVDYSFSLVDATGPVLTAINHDETVLIGDDILVQLEWLSDQNELINGYVIASFNGNMVANQTVSPINTGMSSLLFQTTDWNIGYYEFTVFLFDGYGNPLQTTSTSSMVEIIPLAPLVSGDIDTWDFDSGNLNLTISGQHQFRFAEGLVTITSEGTTLIDNYSIQDGNWSLETSLSSLLQNSIEVQVWVCDATDTTECEQYSNTIDASSAIEYNVDVQCTEVAQSLQMNASETLVSCIIINTDGVYSMHVSLSALQPISFIQDANLEGELPAQGQLEISLLINTGFEEGTWSQPWVLSITNRIGDVSVLNQSSTSFTIISQQQQQDDNNTKTTTEGTSSSTTGMTGIIIAILVVFAIIGTIGYLKLRKPDEVRDDTKSFDSAFDQSQQPIEQEIVEEQPMTVLPSQPFTPAIDATPTSTDEHGYEWFTEENGTNWYRLQGSGSEWYLHQP